MAAWALFSPSTAAMQTIKPVCSPNFLFRSFMGNCLPGGRMVRALQARRRSGCGPDEGLKSS